MARSQIEQTIKQIQESLKDSLDYLDVSYKGLEPGKPFILHGGSAVLNQYKIWLQSTSMDYIRQPGKGGFFDNQLNDRFKFAPESEDPIKQDLIAQTAQRFPNIEILACDVKCDLAKRKWKVHVIVKDKITGLIGMEEEGIEIQASNG